MDAYDMGAYDMDADDMDADDMDAYDMDAYDMDAYDMDAYDVAVLTWHARGKDRERGTPIGCTLMRCIPCEMHAHEAHAL
jgi:hypothetical protein